MRHLRRIVNRIAELRPLSAWAIGVARELGCPAERCPDIDVCLSEAISNVICHGYGDDAPHEIGVELWREPEALVVRIEDDGRPFDPLATQAHRVTTLDEAAPAGRGITLLRSAADAASYERVEGHNRLTLRFEIAA